MSYRGSLFASFSSLSLCALVFAAGCATTSAVETARAPWHEIRSPRFQLWTDGDPEQARALVEDLERFHQVAMKDTTAEEREAAPPLRIFLAKDAASFKLLSGAPRLERGYFVTSTRGNFAMLDGSDGLESSPTTLGGRTILFHEYAHYVLALRGAQVPSWYNEGFAEYMAQTTFREDGSYTTGCVPHYRASWVQAQRWLPLATVMGAEDVGALIQDSSGFVRTRRDAVDAYAQSWYLFHYLAADSQRQSQLREYLKLWQSGVGTEDAVQQAFGQNVDQLNAVIRQYAARRSFDCLMNLPMPLTPAPIQITALSTPGAHYRVGDLMLTMFGPTDAVLSLLQTAAKEGDDARVQTSLARAHWLLAGKAEAPPAAAEELQKAQGYLQRAQKLAPGDPEALLLEGHVLSLEAKLAAESDATAASAKLTAARKAYRLAIRADETLAEAYLGLGQTYLLADSGSEEAIASLEVAAFLLPLETAHALALGQIQMKRGNMLQAIPPLEYVLRWSQDDVARGEARGALERLRSMAATAPPAPVPAPAQP